MYDAYFRLSCHYMMIISLIPSFDTYSTQMKTLHFYNTN